MHVQERGKREGRRREEVTVGVFGKQRESWKGSGRSGGEREREKGDRRESEVKETVEDSHDTF